MLTNLYPTDSSTTYYADKLEFTALIQDINGISLGNDFSAPYYIGYLPNDSFPVSVFGLTMPTLNTNNTTIQLNNHVPENRPFGFCRITETSTNANVLPLQMYYFNTNNALTRYITSSWAGARYINKITLANLTSKDTIHLTIVFRIVQTSDLDENGTGLAIGTYNSEHSVNLETLRKFVNGSDSITCTISQSYITNTKTIRYTDFNPENLTYKYIDGEYTVFVQLQDFTINSGHVYNYENSRIYAVNVVPFYRTHIPAGFGLPKQNIIMMGYNYTDIATDVRYEINDSYSAFTPSGSVPGTPWVSGSYMGNINLHIIRGKYPLDYVSVSDIPHSSSGSFKGIIKNCMFVNGAGSAGKQFSFIPAIDFSDVLKAAMLRNSVYAGANQDVSQLPLQTTYSIDDYVSFFNENDIPYFDSMPVNQWGAVGNYALDSGILRPWQLPGNDITLNEFNVADMPEYNPGGEGGENIGDNVLRPLSLGIGGTNGFVTQYALRAADIQELGEILWTSVFDSDYWQNYMFSLALDTGSFSTSSMLSFFISLKVYPFALMNVPSYTQIDKNIYIGTGIHAIELTNNLHTINNYCDYIPGGECTVWSGNFYNDFRDYVNATYTLYVPYCGTIELNPGDVVHSKLTVQYAVDFATGGCVAYVDVLTQDGKQFPIAVLPGQMGADIPLTATAAGAVAARFVGDAMKFGGLISGEIGNVAGGIAAGMSGKTPTGGGSGNVLSGMAGVMGGLPAAVGMDLAPGVAMQAANMFSRGAVSAPMMSGGQGFASFGAPQKPYLQIRRGIYPEVSGLTSICGSRGAGTYTIGELSGFVQGDVKTDGLNCPENEQIKIRQLIARGIYV